jgi:predicted transcriptional regulator
MRLLKIADEKVLGPSPTYSKAHLLLSILIIGDSGVIGRQALARESGLGEGAIRTIIKKLKQERYIKVAASGCSLTNLGVKLYNDLKRRTPKMISIDRSSLTVGDDQIAILVRNGAAGVTAGIEQRDETIKAGAAGATTFIISRSKFCIPKGSEDCEMDYPGNIWEVLRRQLDPKDGDAIIICGSSDIKLSRIGAISAALTLMQYADIQLAG